MGQEAKKPALPQDLLQAARELRQQQTDAEQCLWRLLRNRQLLGYKFRRQYAILPYILDFYCHEERLAIELDGGHHAQKEQEMKDHLRTKGLESLGIKVIRFWNHEVLQNLEGVLEAIFQQLSHSKKS